MQDGQGSTRTLTNSAGYITDTYDYSAFGELQNQTGTTENKYLYTGQQFDKSTGLYDLRARFYSPSVGRFLSQDTYAVNYNNPIELNRYGYAAGNPVNASDPSGMMADTGLLTLNRIMSAKELAQIFAPFIYGLVAIAAVGLLVAQFKPVDAPTLPKTGRLGDEFEKWLQNWWTNNNPQGSPQGSPSGGSGLGRVVITVVTIIAIFAMLASPNAVQQTVEQQPPQPTEEPTDDSQQIITYRGLDGDFRNGVYIKPIYSPSQFRVDSDGVSTFELAFLPGNKPYSVGFNITIHTYKYPGITGQILGLPECGATYTPDLGGEGHWSINCSGGPETTKQTLSGYAKLVTAILNPNWSGSEERKLP